MRDETIEFHWDVHEAGYRWVKIESANSKNGPDRFLTHGRPLSSVGYAVQRYSPLALYSGLFWQFAETDPTREAVKAFADKFGLLGGDAAEMIGLPEQQTEKGQATSVGERLGSWRQEILAMRTAVELWDWARTGNVDDLSRYISWVTPTDVRYDSHPDWGPDKPRDVRVIANEHDSQNLLEQFRPGDLIQPALYDVQRTVNDRLKGRASPQLLWDRDRSQLGLYFVPHSLLGALWVQFARAIERNNDFRKCTECGRSYELSPQTARSDKVYCSDACRNKAYRKRRAEAVRLCGDGMPLDEIARQLDVDVEVVKRWVARERTPDSRSRRRP